MRLLLVILTILTLLVACDNISSTKAPTRENIQITFTQDTTAPTVEIKAFTLITENEATDSIDAKEIMRLKRTIPLAAQTKDSALLNVILAKEFTFRSEQQFLNKDQFIKTVPHHRKILHWSNTKIWYYRFLAMWLY